MDDKYICLGDYMTGGNRREQIYPDVDTGPGTTLPKTPEVVRQLIDECTKNFAFWSNQSTRCNLMINVRSSILRPLSYHETNNFPDSIGMNGIFRVTRKACYQQCESTRANENNSLFIFSFHIATS